MATLLSRFLPQISLEPSEKRHFPAFDEKLRSKNQSEMQRQQARQAIALYYKGIISHQFPDPKPRIETAPNTNLQAGNAHLIQSALSVKEAQNISLVYAANQQDIAANIKKSNTSIPHNENRSLIKKPIQTFIEFVECQLGLGLRLLQFSY